MVKLAEESKDGFSQTEFCISQPRPEINRSVHKDVSNLVIFDWQLFHKLCSLSYFSPTLPSLSLELRTPPSLSRLIPSLPSTPKVPPPPPPQLPKPPLKKEKKKEKEEEKSVCGGWGGGGRGVCLLPCLFSSVPLL